MKVACVTTYDAKDIRAFGGRTYHMIRELDRQLESFEYIGPLKKPKFQALLFKGKNAFYKTLRKRYSFSRDTLLIKDYARQIAQSLSNLDVDIVFSPTTPGSQPIAYLECKQPIVIWADSTFAGLVESYPDFSKSYLCQETLRDGIANEKAALNRCSLAIYWSQWSAQTAIDNYQIDPAKVKVVPVGAELDCDRTFDDIKTLLELRPTDKCKLLFLGMDWERKGGDIAFQVANKLNQSSLKTELTVVGCQPTFKEPLPNFIKVLGYISKSTKEGLDKINKLFAESHFLIVPSKAEAMGIVFCEASSFGVPSLATNVGGIPTVVRDGLNGKTFAIDASIDEYCTYITNLFSDYSQYKNLALSSFKEYQSRLNRSVAAQTVKKLMMELIA